MLNIDRLFQLEGATGCRPREGSEGGQLGSREDLFYAHNL